MSINNDLDIIARVAKEAGEESLNKLKEKIRLHKENRKYTKAAVKKYISTDQKYIAIEVYAEVINEEKGAWVTALLWVSDDELN